MASTWIRQSLDLGAEEPEAHWLRTVLGRNGLRPTTFKLSPRAADYLYYHYGNRFDAIGATPPTAAATGGPMPHDDLEDALNTVVSNLAGQLRMGQETFEALYKFALDDTSTDDNSTGKNREFNFLVEESAIGQLPTQGLGEHFQVSNIGIGLPASRVNSGEVVNVGSDRPSDDPIELEGNEVIVAIIDDGVGVANERFRLSPTETRIEYFWDMQAMSSGGSAEGSTNGQVFTKNMIDDCLAEHPTDDDLVYRKLGLIDHSKDKRQPLKFRLSHGTHVSDIAAGFDYRDEKQKAIAKKRPIIAVQLPSEMIAERSDVFTAPHLKAALQKIRYFADLLADRIAAKNPGEERKPLPIVVNFSFGTMAGPHDGQAPIDRAVRDFITSYRSQPGNPQCELVMPAGNGFQARTVARLDVGEDGKIEPLPWRVQPDDKTSSYVQVWLPENQETRQQIAVSLVPPYDAPEEPQESKLGHSLEWQLNGQVQARLYHQFVERPDGCYREHITIAILGTDTDKGDPTTYSGEWEIRMKSIDLRPGTRIDARIQRDDSLMGQRRTGRQSYFDHPDYVRYEYPSGRLRSDCGYLANDCHDESSPVTRCGTFNAYATANACATAPEPLVVGGYRRSDGVPASYTGSGPTTSGRTGPDISAVSEESPSHRGVLGSGTNSGSIVTQNGTSVATPAVTRILAQIIADKQTKKDLIRSIRRAENAGIGGPHGVYGDLCLPRQGDGRHFSDKQPDHRKRIDG